MSPTRTPFVDRDPETTDLLIEEPVFLLSSQQYLSMIDAGLFPEDSRTELWGGRIYEKMSKNRPHNVSSSKANRAIVRALPDGYFVGNEHTIVTGPRTAPLPDLVILRGDPDDFRHRRPEAGDVRLVIELAESSLRSDMGPKLRGYAAAGVLEYWVVNLVENLVHVFLEPVPSESRYAHASTHSRGEALELLLDGHPPIAIAVDDLLPAA